MAYKKLSRIKTLIRRCLFATSLLVTTQISWAFTSGVLGSNPGNTGGAGTCAGCHAAATAWTSSGSLSFASGAAFSSDTTLKLGQPYTLRFTNTISGGTRGAFNLGDGALTSTFATAGGNPLSFVGTTPDTEISHNYSAAGPGVSTWTFLWTPTSTGTGQTFSWCALATNGSGSTGDGITQCTSSNSFSVEANVAPVITGPGAPVVFTASSNPATRVITGVAATDSNTGDTAGLTYQWTPATGLSNANIQQPVYQGSGRTTYTVTATDEIGAVSNIATVIVDIDPAPTALISGDIGSALENTQITLLGTTSTDFTDSINAGTIASYNWTVSRISNPTFATGTSPTITFTTPDQALNDTEDLTVVLQVTDSQGQTDTDTITIQVSDIAVGDTPPSITSITASTPQNENTTITLTATVIDDNALDNNDFLWTVDSGPSVTLTQNGPVASFSYDVTDPNQAGQAFVFRLSVDDSVGQNDQDTVAVTVNNGPTADAVTGSDTAADEGTTVNLSATSSFDPGAGSLTYAWTQVSGPTITTINNAGSATASFTAPDVGRTGDTVVVRVTVTDAGGLTDSDDHTVSITNVNAAPTAIAGDDQSIDENTAGALNGDYTDPDDPGSTITYAWTQTSGPTITLSDANAPAPTFTTPEVSAAGDTAVFSLIVSDEEPLASAPDTVTITINNVNRPPTADAGPDQSVQEGDSVALNGSNSDDDDDRLSLVYSWQRISGPNVTLSDPNIASPTFTAPVVGFDSGPVVLRLTVTDTLGASDSDDVIINVSNLNVAPIANAGPDQNVNESGVGPNIVTLDARGSVDPDLAVDDVLSFSWVQLTGPVVTLTGGNTATPTFAAPQVAEVGASLSFEVTVTDRGNLADTDSVIVNVADADTPPVADAGPDQNVAEGDTVSLSGDNSSDADGGIASFAWRQISGPAITFSAPNASNTTFVAPKVTDDASINLQLTVTDEAGLQATDNVTVNVMDASEEAPVANAGADQTVTELDIVMLDGSASSDLDGNIDTVFWSQLEGIGVVLSDPTSIAPTFTAPIVGTNGAALVFQIQVTDTSMLSASDTVIINVSNTAGSPIAVAGDDQNAIEGNTVTLDGSGSSDPFGATLTYLWQQTAGPNVVLSDPTTTMPTFVAPAISAANTGTVVTFGLTITSDGLMASDAVSVTVDDNGITGFDETLPSINTSADGAVAFDVDNGNLVGVSVVPANTITETDGRPETIYTDLFNFDISVTTPGDTVTVTVLFENPLPADAGWAKYSETNGWTDFSDSVTLANDGLSAQITLTDGGSGDDDGMANGRIIDPSGPGVFAAAPVTVAPPVERTPRSKSGGGCSIGTGGPADPTLPFLTLIGVLYFLRRRYRS